MKYSVNQLAYAELLVAAVLWGFSFIAIRWMLSDFSPFLGTFIRFIVSFLMGILIIGAHPSLRGKQPLSDIRVALVPGILLGLTIVLQTQGLTLTLVANASFITTLYVVFIPLIEWLHFKTQITRRDARNLFLAIAGTILICRIELGSVNLGDLLTLGCAVVAGYHIVLVGLVSSRIHSAFTFNVGQSLWAGLVLLPGTLFFEETRAGLSIKSIGGILILAILVNLVAFTIQVRAQKVLKPLVVSMFFLLESPLATLFAFLFFHEQVFPLQWLGALLVMGAAYGAVYRPPTTSQIPAP